MLNRFFWGRWVVMPAKYGLQVTFADRKDWPRLRQDGAFLHYTAHTKPWDLRLWHYRVEQEKDLWRESLKNATAVYNLTLADLTSGGHDLGWPVAKLAGLEPKKSRSPLHRHRR